MSDSTWFDMRATLLEPALQIAFNTSPSGKAWGYKSTTERLVFAWHESANSKDNDFIPFITPITYEEAVPLVKKWCQEVANYGSQPDHDGDNSRSWRVYCEGWGFIDHNQYTFAAVEPYWAQFGK